MGHRYNDLVQRNVSACVQVEHDEWILLEELRDVLKACVFLRHAYVGINNVHM